MKFVMAALFLIVSSLALAQTLEIEIGGVRHSCTPIGSGGPGPGRLDCIETAYNGPFTRDEAHRLCEGAFSDAPARCAVRAYRGPLTRDESMNLCRRAFSEGPIECVEISYRGPFTRDEALALCSHPRASAQNAHCALRAYQGPYSREESIRLCKVQGQYGLKNFLKIELGKDEEEELIKKANLKAFQLGDYK
jgi:hypothetical protein